MRKISKEATSKLRGGGAFEHICRTNLGGSSPAGVLLIRVRGGKVRHNDEAYYLWKLEVNQIFEHCGHV